MRRRGDIEWVPLAGDLAGYEIGIEHIGPGAVNRWLRQVEALKLRELPRLLALRAGLAEFRDVAPQLWPESIDTMQIVSAEGRDEEEAMARAALLECVRTIRRDGTDFGLDPSGAVAEIERWGLLGAIFVAAIQAQQLSPTDPLAAGDRTPPVGGSASDVGHPGGGV